MKKILFIMNNLDCGGAEKALVSLLNEVDFSAYEVDLFLFSHKGLFLKQIPEQVNLLPEPSHYRYFDMPLKKAVIDNLKNGRVKVALARIGYGIALKTQRVKVRKAQAAWKFLRLALPKLPKRYDAAVGYMENEPNYFCIDKVRAETKIGFIHNDYVQLGMDPEIDRPYFSRFDKIFTITESCQSVLEKTFPTLKNRFAVMYNIVSPETVRSLAAQPLPFDKKGITLVSVGRLDVQKGFDTAVSACRHLRDVGHDVYWYVIGEGIERAALEKEIAALGLTPYFKLIGLKENPYQYMALADIYVQPSRFEGKSIAIDEAKILCKPIVVTNFPSVHDQIRHKITGYICEMDARAIADGISTLIQNPALADEMAGNLKKEPVATAGEMEKLFRFFR